MFKEFLQGMASIGQGWFDITDSVASSFAPSKQSKPRPSFNEEDTKAFEDDAKALQSDWEVIGKDFEQIIPKGNKK